MISRRLLPTLDLNFLGTVLVIAAVGCMLIYSATYFGDPSLNILRKQLLWMAIGFALMAVFIVVDYHVLFDIAPILYGIGMVLLAYLLVWGKVRAHVRSWIQLPGGFQFQPSEFMKIFTALMLARFFGNHSGAYLDLRAFLKAMAIIGIPVALILLQPDFGTCATFFPLAGAAMFFGGIRWRVWAGMAVACALLAVLGWGIMKPYQRDRIATVLNPSLDPLGRGYQVTQAKIAIGSGGIHGKGFRNGTQAKLEFLPARHTDFIFAVLGEEWGFIGVLIVLALYLYLIAQALFFARHARDRGGAFLVICLICFFVFHVFINVAMQIGVLPTTGIPLPLVSYGGSSTMMFLIAIGLMANVDARRFVNV
jgi:rod shape determining protein RodA